MSPTTKFVVAAFVCAVVGCSSNPPPVEKPAGPVPDIQSATDGLQNVSILVSAPDSDELRGHLERGFLKAGFLVVKVPADANLVVTLNDAGGSFSNAGIRGGLSFSETTRKMVATVTRNGRFVHEIKVENSFTVTEQKDEKPEAMTRRLAEQSTASWNIIAVTVINETIAKLKTSTEPAGGVDSAAAQ